MMRVDRFAEACRLENLTKKFSEQNEVVDSHWFRRDERHGHIIIVVVVVVVVIIIDSSVLFVIDRFRHAFSHIDGENEK